MAPGQDRAPGEPADRAAAAHPAPAGDPGDPGQAGDPGDPDQTGDPGDPGLVGDPGDPGLVGDCGGGGIAGADLQAEALLSSVLTSQDELLDAPRGRPVYRGDMLELVYSRSRSSRPAQSEWAELSDRDLLLSLREGSEQALDELIGRKTKPLLQLVSRILGDMEEARDVVQVTFFKVWENRRKFDERWSPNTWIYRIASNLAIDHLRARRSRERIQEPVRQHLRQVADGRAHRDLSRLQQGEVATIFRELAASLSEKQRMVFLLREIEGLSSPEVAAIVGCRESTVRNHLFNARKSLRTELLRRYPEYAGAMTTLGAGAEPLPGAGQELP